MTIPVVSLGSAPFEVPAEPPARFLLIGDAASVPAINSVLTALPPDADVLLPLAEHPRRRVHWVDRVDETSLAGSVEDRDWSNWYAWVGCEAGSAKHLVAGPCDGTPTRRR
jgi:ATP-binding cassette subfamily B protein IrtA